MGYRLKASTKMLQFEAIAMILLVHPYTLYPLRYSMNLKVAGQAECKNKCNNGVEIPF